MSASEQSQMERQHIVAVNSSPEFLEVVRELLQDEAYNVTTTNFTPDSFDQIATLQPSLLIIDLAVGERAGWDLLERLEADADTHGIPVIVVSTNADYLEAAKAQPDRFAGQRFLRKPVDLDEVLQKIEELIGRA